MVKQARSKVRQAEVLRAARALLLETGELTISSLSTRSGASVGSLYHHFESKEGVLVAVADAATADYEKSLYNFLRTVPMRLKPTLKAIVAHHVTFSRAHGEVASLLRVLRVSPARLMEGAQSRLRPLMLQAVERRLADPVPEDLLPAIVLGPVLASDAPDDDALTILARATWRAVRRPKSPV